MTVQEQGILDTFQRLKYPAVFFDDAPEGRFACYLFLKPNGFVWLEPGYQSPWERFSRLRSIDSPLELKGGCLVFENGWIGEGNPSEAEVIWHYWLDYRRQFDRDWRQERDYVLHDCLNATWDGQPLV